MIVSFAQKDVVRNFLDGIHPNLENELRDEIQKILNPTDISEIEKNIR